MGQRYRLRVRLNEPRFSNYFIEKRGSSYVESLVTRGFPLFVAPDLFFKIPQTQKQYFYIGPRFRATPRNDMKKPHHLPISANCGGGSAYFRCMGKLNQAGKQRLSARIRFASANNIFNFAICFRRPRYRVFRYRNRPFTTPKTFSTFARTDDFSCSLRFN